VVKADEVVVMPDSPDPITAPSTPARIEWSGLVILVAGALAVLGSFMPWETFGPELFGVGFNRGGLDTGGGIFTLPLGVLIALLGIAVLTRSGRPRTAKIGVVACGAVLLGVDILAILSTNELIRDVTARGLGASLGTGLFVIAFAAVLSLVGAMLPGRKTDRPIGH
jgi:hypothetical protein